MTDDRYQRRKDLGAGGMATVYEAWDTQLERAVAIKEPRPDASGLDPGFNDRFLAEARRLALVRHPHVVEIYDVDAAHHPPRIIMELADGGSLRDRLAEGTLPPTLAIAVLKQLLAGLAAIHQAGLVHRDLKPENILDFRDVYKIADFGIAKRDSEKTQRYVTPKYTAPEVQSGRGSSPRADVYSLGLIVFELVIGSVRFESLVAASWQAAYPSHRASDGNDTAAVSWSAWHRDSSLTLASLDELALVPPAFAAVVARMTAKRPLERYADAGAVLAALARPTHQVDRAGRNAKTETVPEPIDDQASTWDLERLRAQAGQARAGTPKQRRSPIRGVLIGLLTAAAAAAVGLTALVRLTHQDDVLPAPLRDVALHSARSSDSAQAARLIDQALDDLPNDPELLEAGIRSHFQLANYGKAAALADRLAAVRPPGDPMIDYHRGLITLARTPNRAASAVPYLERAAGRAGIPSDGYFFLGFARMQGGDRTGACNAFERFLAYGDGSEALAERARRYLAASRKPADSEAVTAYDQPLVLRGYQRSDLAFGALRGHVVVLHLWATWCAPCKEELPSLARFFERDYPELQARGLRVVTVSSDFSLGDLASFLRRQLTAGLPEGFPVYWDPDSELNRHLRLGSALPQTVILDRRGRRLRQVTGAIDWESERLLGQLASYL